MSERPGAAGTHGVDCLPIVSGNIGAFPAPSCEGRGLPRVDTVGEDLELTWRVHRAGYQVRFQPLALVRAESPSTVRDLWKQRVRWARGLLQTVRLQPRHHREPAYGVFGRTALQRRDDGGRSIAAAARSGPAAGWDAAGSEAVPSSLVAIVASGTCCRYALVVSFSLNRAWGTCVYLPCSPWPVYSVFAA